MEESDGDGDDRGATAPFVCMPGGMGRFILEAAPVWTVVTAGAMALFLFLVGVQPASLYFLSKVSRSPFSIFRGARFPNRVKDPTLA